MSKRSALTGLLPAAKKNKYRAIRTEVDGIVFASKKEAQRYSELVILQRAGLISDLETQPKFPIKIKGDLVCTYIGDFMYIDLAAEGGLKIEDVKGVRTPMYRLKNKLVKALYGFDIIEV